MSRFNIIKSVAKKITPYKVNYTHLVLNQNYELSIENHKYWIGNALMTTRDLLNIEKDLKRSF